MNAHRVDSEMHVLRGECYRGVAPPWKALMCMRSCECITGSPPASLVATVYALELDIRVRIWVTPTPRRARNMV